MATTIARRACRSTTSALASSGLRSLASILPRFDSAASPAVHCTPLGTPPHHDDRTSTAAASASTVPTASQAPSSLLRFLRAPQNSNPGAGAPRRTSPQEQVQARRSVTYMPKPGDGKPRAVTLLPGDGVGPLVTGAVVQVMEAMHAPVYFETFEVSGRMEKVPDEVIESLKKNQVGIKGGFTTPVGGGVSSLNVQLRKELDLFAHLVFCANIDGLPMRHDGVNIVVIRENTEGEYSGLEHEVVSGVVESLKVITKFCSERIARYAFEYAYLNARKTVTAVHKANIMKLADGLFLESCREVAKSYPMIEYNEVIVDNCCMQLVSRPQQFDVMVTPNLYGTLVANTAAGICGGTTVMPGGNVGENTALFEQGASAGNVGTEETLLKKAANPTALLLSAAMMLRHLQFPTFADNLESAVLRVIKERKVLTPDLGGTATTQHMVDAVCEYLV